MIDIATQQLPTEGFDPAIEKLVYLNYQKSPDGTVFEQIHMVRSDDTIQLDKLTTDRLHVDSQAVIQDVKPTEPIRSANAEAWDNAKLATKIVLKGLGRAAVYSILPGINVPALSEHAKDLASETKDYFTDQIAA